MSMMCLARIYTKARQVINFNGLDLSTEGGLVWIKNRCNYDQIIYFDTERGGNVIKDLLTTDSEYTLSDYFSIFQQ